jgi:hypothetical protein
MANEDEQSPGEAQDDAQLWFRLRIKLTDTSDRYARGALDRYSG